MLAAFLVTAACLCLPVGEIEPAGMGVSAVVYNLLTRQPDAASSYGNIPLFIFLVLSCPVVWIAIFSYRRRKLQAKLCTLNIVLLLAWYVYLGFCWLSVFQTDGSTFHVKLATSFPLIAIILYVMARKGILDDEKLVRAADRIR